MTIKKLIYKIKPPCAKCPYQLGLVEAVADPCPRCKMSGYQTYEQFKQQVQRREIG